MQLAMFLLCVVLVAFALPARSQDQSSTVSQTGTSTAKAKANGEEAEAGTNEATEALQKATQSHLLAAQRYRSSGFCGIVSNCEHRP